MLFEGSEKKIEIIFNPNLPSLRKLDEEFWHKVVHAAGAKILSKISNESIDAYLLSESSLFVYDHYVVMITCGRTKLIKAVRKMISHFKPQNIDAFFYERKHEVFAQYQPSHFYEDLIYLNKWFDGEAMRFGDEDEHHLFLFSSKKPFTPEKDDHTMEILMHGVQSKNIEMFQKQGLKRGLEKTQIREISRVDSLIQGKVDDHVFDPCGYSLNAIDGPYYYTIHVTPEKIGNYTSFETDSRSVPEQKDLAERVIDVFEPNSFDVVLFNSDSVPAFAFEGYHLKNQYVEKISSGYNVQFMTYYKPQEGPEGAFFIEEGDL